MSSRCKTLTIPNTDAEKKVFQKVCEVVSKNSIDLAPSIVFERFILYMSTSTSIILPYKITQYTTPGHLIMCIDNCVSIDALTCYVQVARVVAVVYTNVRS